MFPGIILQQLYFLIPAGVNYNYTIVTVKLYDLTELDFSVYAVFCMLWCCLYERLSIPSPVLLISILVYSIIYESLYYLYYCRCRVL